VLAHLLYFLIDSSNLKLFYLKNIQNVHNFILSFSKNIYFCLIELFLLLLFIKVYDTSLSFDFFDSHTLLMQFVGVFRYIINLLRYKYIYMYNSVPLYLPHMFLRN